MSIRLAARSALLHMPAEFVGSEILDANDYSSIHEKTWNLVVPTVRKSLVNVTLQNSKKWMDGEAAWLAEFGPDGVTKIQTPFGELETDAKRHSENRMFFINVRLPKNELRFAPDQSIEKAQHQSAILVHLTNEVIRVLRKHAVI